MLMGNGRCEIRGGNRRCCFDELISKDDDDAFACAADKASAGSGCDSLDSKDGRIGIEAVSI